jgi:RHS repeat-associated protein
LQLGFLGYWSVIEQYHRWTDVKLRRFRNEVLSGTAVGERVIGFYYRGFSPVVVAVLREYPELRTLARLGLRAAGAVADWLVPAARADLLQQPFTYEIYWYFNDHLGATIALLDQSGNVRFHVERDAFGNVESKYAEVDDAFLYPGQFWDEQAQLAYNWFRWYSPALGRYVQVDPLLTVGTSDVLAYAYADNNPLLFIDPTGLIVKRCKVALDIPLGKAAYNGGVPKAYHEYIELNGKAVISEKNYRIMFFKLSHINPCRPAAEKHYRPPCRITHSRLLPWWYGYTRPTLPGWVTYARAHLLPKGV